jgi:hypothetical protein
MTTPSSPACISNDIDLYTGSSVVDVKLAPIISILFKLSTTNTGGSTSMAAIAFIGHGPPDF